MAVRRGGRGRSEPPAVGPRAHTRPFDELTPDPVRREELELLVGWLTAAAVAFGTAELAAGLWLADIPLLVTAGSTGGYALWLLAVVKPFLERDRIGAAVGALAAGLLTLVVVCALALPSAAGVLAIAAVLASVVALPHLSERWLRPLMLGTWVVICAVVGAAELLPERTAAPHDLLALLRFSASAVGAGLLLAALWQSSSRLREAFGQLSQSSAELTDVNIELRTRLQDLQSRDREITLMAQIAELLEACETREESAAVVEHDVAKLFPGDSGAYYEPVEDTGLLLRRAGWGPLRAGERIDGASECWALRRGRTHAVLSTSEGPMCDHATPDDEAASICAPLTAQGRLLGLLHVRAHGLPAGGKGQTELDERVRLVETVAEHVGIRLANIDLRRTLREQSIRDPLTGLFNRRYMEESLRRELLRSEREAETLGVIILDLDHFKVLNDRYGHVSGDLVLRHLSHMLVSKVRGEDIVCRFGGEEFVMILPKATLEDTRRRAETIRTAARSLRVDVDGQVLGATISLGVAAFPMHGADPETLLRAADDALYRAKAEGRDRVVTASRERALLSGLSLGEIGAGPRPVRETSALRPVIQKDDSLAR